MPRIEFKEAFIIILIATIFLIFAFCTSSCTTDHRANSMRGRPEYDGCYIDEMTDLVTCPEINDDDLWKGK